MRHQARVVSQWGLNAMMRIVALSVYGVIGAFCLWLVGTTQEWWSVLALPAIFFGIIPLLDIAIGEREIEPAGAPDSRWYNLCLYLQVPIHFALFVGAIWIATETTLPLAAKVANTISFGLLNGQCALIAHEFAHKNGRTQRISAEVTLAVIGMGHFLVEHVRGHHVHVCTPIDCASARLGESIYHFALRDLPGEVRGGLAREAERLRGRGRSAWSASNTVLQSYAMSVFVAIALVAKFGWMALAWIALHHVFAWFTLTLVTYIEHYGLLRERTGDGRYEPVQPLHSWNTNAALSNLLLLNVQRHSHHHARPMVAYQALRNFPEAPQLPTGYFGMIVLAMFPPLWFKVMDRRALRAMAGRITRLHLGERPSRRVTALVSECDIG